MTRLTRRVMLSIPEPFLETIDSVARAEHRTRSDLVREALRRYLQIREGEVPSPLPASPRAESGPGGAGLARPRRPE